MNEEELINELRTIQKSTRRLLPELRKKNLIRAGSQRERILRDFDKVIYKIIDEVVEWLNVPLEGLE